MGRFETQLVYDVHDLHTQEYLRTFSTMDQGIEYCRVKQDEASVPIAYEIKTVVRLYWVED